MNLGFWSTAFFFFFFQIDRFNIAAKRWEIQAERFTVDKSFDQGVIVGRRPSKSALVGKAEVATKKLEFGGATPE